MSDLHLRPWQRFLLCITFVTLRRTFLTPFLWGKHSKCLWCVLWSSPNLFDLINCCSAVEFMMQIAISGTEFCGAAGRATKLIGTNKLRVATVIAIGDLILFLGKLCVSFASAFFASLMLDTHRYKTSQHRVSSPLFPVLVSFLWPPINWTTKRYLSRKTIFVLDMPRV